MGEKKLGRGLESFFSGAAEAPAGADSTAQRTELPIDSIRENTDQPRKEFSESALEDLKKSILEKGVIQPLIVRPMGSRYELIAGERRWRAAKAAGLKKVPVVIKDVPDGEALEISLIENIQREDLNPIERARAYQQLVNRFNLTQEEAAGRVGQDRSTVANFIRLMDLSIEVQAFVSRGTLGMGHARALLSIENHEDQNKMANVAIRRSLSVRAVERLVKSAMNPQSVKNHGNKKKPYLLDLENKFIRKLGTKVEIMEGKKKGSGKVVIDFYNLDDFDRISSFFGLGADS